MRVVRLSLFLGLILVIFFGIRTYVTAPVDNIITIGDMSLYVEVAESQEKLAEGLMNREYLNENSGMLFLFDSADVRTFWNQNTLIPLDIVWVRGGVVVGTSSLPSIKDGLQIISSPGKVDKVVEVNFGWTTKHNINNGDLVSLP